MRISSRRAAKRDAQSASRFRGTRVGVYSLITAVALLSTTQHAVAQETTTTTVASPTTVVAASNGVRIVEACPHQDEQQFGLSGKRYPLDELSSPGGKALDYAESQPDFSGANLIRIEGDGDNSAKSTYEGAIVLAFMGDLSAHAAALAKTINPDLLVLCKGTVPIAELERIVSLYADDEKVRARRDVDTVVLRVAAQDLDVAQSLSKQHPRGVQIIVGYLSYPDASAVDPGLLAPCGELPKPTKTKRISPNGKPSVVLLDSGDYRVKVPFKNGTKPFDVRFAKYRAFVLRKGTNEVLALGRGNFAKGTVPRKRTFSLTTPISVGNCSPGNGWTILEGDYDVVAVVTFQPSGADPEVYVSARIPFTYIPNAKPDITFD
jgi:hypothetical protein